MSHYFDLNYSLMILKPYQSFPGIFSQDVLPVFAAPLALQVNAGSRDNWSMLAPASPHWAPHYLRCKEEKRHQVYEGPGSAPFRAPLAHRHSPSSSNCAASASAEGSRTHGSFRMPGCRRWGLFPRKPDLLSTWDTPGTRAARACGPGKKSSSRGSGKGRGRSLREGPLGAGLFPRPRASRRAGTAATHPGPGSYSHAAAPSA